VQGALLTCYENRAHRTHRRHRKIIGTGGASSLPLSSRGEKKGVRADYHHHLANITRLYEQGASLDRIENYIRHWWRWLQAGLIINISIGEILDYPVPGYDAPLLPFVVSPFTSVRVHSTSPFT